MNIFVNAAAIPVEQKGFMTDTIWFETDYTNYDYFYPIHFYSEIMDTIFTGIRDAEADSFIIDVFPNPARDQINLSVHTDGRKKIIVEITNLANTWSELVYNGDVDQGTEHWRISLATKVLPAKGIYLVRVKYGNSYAVKKILVL
jgi:hypothetical protein